LRNSTPIAAAATKPVFQAAALGLAAILLFLCLPALSAAARTGAFSAAAVRIRALEACGSPATRMRDIDLSSFGLLHGGCTIGATGGTFDGGSSSRASNESDGVWTVRFPSAVDANGYYFDTPQGPGAAPCRWVVEAEGSGGAGDSDSPTGGGRWTAVSASVWRTARGGGRDALRLYPELHTAAPAAGGTRVVMDHGVAVLPSVISGLVDLELAACMLCMVGAARLEREDAVRGIVLTFIAGAAALTAAEAVAWAAAGDSRAEADAALRVAALATLGLALALWERHLVPTLFAAAAVYTAAIAAAESLYGADWLRAVEQAVGPEYCAVAFALAFGALVIRWAVLGRARRLVVADAARYNAIWADISGGEDARRLLSEIKEQVRSPSYACADCSKSHNPSI
jgi:hypothetical protein